MESLPTELLTSILRLAASDADGHWQLLDCFPLVCRRWRDLCRDPRCWPPVDLVVVSPEFSPDLTFVRGCRLVARAPALRSLFLTVRNNVMINYDASRRMLGRALSAMAANRAAVQRLAITDHVWTKLTPQGRSAFLRILWRSRFHLRSLLVTVDPAALRRRPGRLHVLEVVACLPRLQDLWLDLTDVRKPDIAYDGELACMASSSLRSLKMTIGSGGGFSPGMRALAEDLLRCGAASLETVKLDESWELPESTLRLLDACPRLAALSASSRSCLGASAAMDRVQRLVLEVYPDWSFSMLGRLMNLLLNTGATAAAQAVAETVAACRRYRASNLRDLTVHLSGPFHSERKVKAETRDAVAELKDLWPHVKINIKVSTPDAVEAREFLTVPVVPFSDEYDYLDDY